MAEEVTTQVPGNVWKVLVKTGDQVKAGDVLFILEVMKTEVPHAAGVAGHDVEVRFPILIRPEGALGLIDILDGQEHVDPTNFEVGGLAGRLERGHEVEPRLPTDLLRQVKFAIHDARGVTPLNNHDALVRGD